MRPSDEIHYDPVADRILDPDHEVAQRRRTGRVELEAVTCNMGRVADLSAGGLRLTGPCLPREALIPLRLTMDECTVQLVGRIVWIKPAAGREVEMGIEFLEVSAEQRARLTQFATANRWRRVM